jgi:hypothetical protein
MIKIFINLAPQVFMRLRIIILIGFLVGTGFALQYIESSTGLTPPNWEDGRAELEFDDINNDGYPDILSIGDHGSPYINSQEHGIMVWFGNGQGGWTNYMNGNFGYGGIAIGDVNNDRYLDVGYGMHHNYSSTDFGDQLIEVALGDGTGMNWIPWDDSLGLHGQTWGMFGTDFADVDNDGDLDLGSVSFGCCDGIHVYLNNMNGTWSRSFGFIGGNSNMEFQFGDFNKDGNIDFAVTHQYSSVYFGDGNGNFTSAHSNLPAPGNVGYRSIAVGDVDNDGGADLAFITSGGGVFVYIYDEQIGTWQNFSGTLPLSGNYQRIALWDMNGDGFCDVVAQGNSFLRIWLGNGIGNWNQVCEITTPGPGTGQALAVRDCDNNGCADIAMVLNEGSWPSYRNRLRFFKETSIPSSVSLIPIFPKGHERFHAGAVNFIKWQSKVPNNNPSWVKIEFSPSGDRGSWQVLFESLPNNGKKQWTIPNYSTSDAHLRLTVYTASETCFVISGPFTIFGGTPAINETSEVKTTGNLTYLITGNNFNLPLLSKLTGSGKIKIFELDGKLVYQAIKTFNPKENRLVLEKLKLRPGRYILEILDSNQRITAQLIVAE